MQSVRRILQKCAIFGRPHQQKTPEEQCLVPEENGEEIGADFRQKAPRTRQGKALQTLRGQCGPQPSQDPTIQEGAETAIRGRQDQDHRFHCLNNYTLFYLFHNFFDMLLSRYKTVLHDFLNYKLVSIQFFYIDIEYKYQGKYKIKITI